MSGRSAGVCGIQQEAAQDEEADSEDAETVVAVLGSECEAVSRVDGAGIGIGASDSQVCG